MTWQSGGGGGGGYPGVVSDGANGLDVTGIVSAGKLGAGLTPDEFSDIFVVEDGSGNTYLDYDETSHRLHIGGHVLLHTIGPAPPQLTFVGTGGNDDIDIQQNVDGSLLIFSAVTVRGGLSAFDHTPPDAPRTLAQSVITAVTDANAKSAIQAIANALADSGQLTLT